MLSNDVITLREEKRVYMFPNNDLVELKNVTELIVSEPSSNHRIKADKKLHVIPNKWLAIHISGAIETKFSENKTTTLYEKERKYIFPNNNVITFEHIHSITVSNSDLHYLTLANGDVVIVNTGWIAIEIDDTEWTV